jgi:hypothetical protein
MAFAGDSGATRAEGGHAAQWGLAAILVGSLVVVLFPIAIGIIFAALYGAYEDVFAESRDFDLGIRGGWALVGAVAALALFSLICGIAGLASARARSQPVGLSVAGTAVALVAVAAAVVLLFTGVRATEWTRWLQEQRFQKGIQHPSPPPRR